VNLPIPVAIAPGVSPARCCFFGKMWWPTGHFLPVMKFAVAPNRPELADRRLIIYCHRGARAATVYAALQLAGYDQLAIYVGSWHEWAEQQTLPLLTGG
jgi:rhodanese-related sulfurtransferase